jgi:type VI secretion system protein ImpH
MAAEIGSADAPLKPRGQPGVDDLVLREAYRFEFFQAVRLLERMYPARKPVGRHELPKDEAIRFRTHVSMQFPASELYEVVVRPAAEGEREGQPTAWVTFMGLAGSLGVLPSHYTQMLSDPSLRHQTAALRDFLDIFNHRFISLFYRAWEKYRFAIAYERGEDDSFSQQLFSLIGMGTAGLQKQLGISDQILLYYAGLLSQRPRAASALEGLLQDYFGVPVQVEQFTGEWFLMNVDALTSLGRTGQNNQLGVNTSLWERVWDPQARFRVKLGPLTYTQFQDFLPTSDAYRHAVELTRFFVGEEMGFEIQPILRADEVPWCALGVSQSTRLGWAMWLKTTPFEADTTQPVFAARVATLVGDARA